MLGSGERLRLGARRLKSRLKRPALGAVIAAAAIAGPLSGTAFAKVESHPLRALMKRRGPRRIYGEAGGLVVRMAETRADVRRAQRLRYQVFFEEMAASPSLTAKLRRLDQDPYDSICDHLLVTDGAATAPGAPWSAARHPKVVGTYRLLRREHAERGSGFYTEGEYDLAPLLARLPRDARVLELGRSCVLAPYRTKRTVELLWHGLWTYVRENRIDVMIGCASFEGTDPHAHAAALSLLHHQSLAPPEWRCRAHARLHQRMDLIPAEKLDMKAALKSMPPLIKGYMRLGAYVGDGAVVDTQFGTTDVLIVLPVANINPRYFGHFGAPDEQKSRVSAGH